MKHWTARIALVTVIALACGEPRSRTSPAGVQANPTTAQRPQPVAPSHTPAPASTGALATAAPSDSVLASDASYSIHAVHHDSVTDLVTFVRDSAGVRAVGEAISIGRWEPPTVEVATVGPRKALRVLSYDLVAENIVGTTVDYMDGVSVRRVYSDPDTGCRAAQFVRQNGKFFIIEFASSPFDADCVSPCAEALRSTMDFEPARAIFLAWDGVRWVRARNDVLERRIGDAYDRALGALRAGTLPECASQAAELTRSFDAWRSERAPSISN